MNIRDTNKTIYEQFNEQLMKSDACKANAWTDSENWTDVQSI